MTDIRVQKQSERFGSYEDLGPTEIWDATLTVSYSHAACLKFHMTAPQHTLPLTFNDFIRFWDHGAAHPSGGTQSSTAPLFEGFVEDITPGNDTNEVVITCYDPTYRCDKMIQVMGEPWQANGSDFPVPSEFSHPRVVYNTTIDNDDDFGLALLLGSKVGEIVALILSDHIKPLYYLNAAPGSGSLGGESQPWDDSEMAAIDIEPQGKFVAQSETPRSLVMRILSQYQPAHKLIWTPGDRIWHVKDTLSSTARTITVNTKAPSTYHSPVLSFEPVRSTEGRYGAVQFFGPQDIEWREAIVALDEEGEPLGDPEPTLEIVTDGNVVVNEEETDIPCINGLQIIDPDFTRIARKGPYAINVPGPGAFWRTAEGAIVANIVTSYVQTWGWSLQILFAQGSGGDSYWQSISGYYVDIRTGTITLGNTCLYRIKAPPLGGDGTPELPSAIRFVYPALVNPLKVRYPSSGYSGTIASVAGIENEWRIYDEDLAVFRDFGQSVTTGTRLSRFEELAEQTHRKVKDLVIAGGVVTNGLDYDFAFLDRRVNITARDDYGNTLTTGWESVNAAVTDVEYDFEERTTTLQINSDELELIGMDPDLMKQRLKIRAATPVNVFVPMVGSAIQISSASGRSATLGQSANPVQVMIDDRGEIQ